MTEPPRDPAEDSEGEVEEGSQDEDAEDRSQSAVDEPQSESDEDHEGSEPDSEASNLPADQQWDESRLANAEERYGGRTEQWVRGRGQ